MFERASAQIRPEIRYAWRGPSQLVVDTRGRCGTADLTGYYFRETRYLSELRLEVAGEEPFPCSVAEAGTNVLECTYIYPPVETRGGGGSGSGGSGSRHGILFRGLDLDLRYTLAAASFEAVLRVTSRWDEAVSVELGWALAADFAGLSEAQAGEREQEAPVQSEATPGGVRFRYTHAALPLETHVGAEGGGRWEFADGRLSTRIELERQSTVELRLSVRAVDFEDPIDGEAEREREEHLAEWVAGAAVFHAPAESPIVELTNRAMRDLGSAALLEGPREEWLAPAAGYPLYPALFGRDALTATWQAAAFDRGAMAASTLEALSVRQGTGVDAWRDEEPGRIVQQARREPLARLNATPFTRYYGDFASPFMFIIALGNAYAWSGEKRLIERHWDAARRILDWARRSGDRDGDGYLDYLTQSPKGPKHQGWKDSDNAVVHADGSQAEPPIVPSEIQGYWYVSLQFMAVFAAVLGERTTAAELWLQARGLKERFNRDFWLDEEGVPAFGLDAEKRPIRSVASNVGHCLTTGIIDDEKLPRVVRRLFEADMFSGWGIRTLSSEHPAYQPLSYHLGSVWAVENGTILFGLRRFGFDERAVELARGLYDLALLWPAGRIPEAVGGYARGGRGHPGAYPRANTPQAWNQSVWPIVVQSLLGMRAVAALDTLALDPILPPWLPELTIQRLRVGGATATLRFRRDASGHTDLDVVEKEGTLHIVRQPPIDSLTAGVWDRLGALAGNVLPS